MVELSLSENLAFAFIFQIREFIIEIQIILNGKKDVWKYIRPKIKIAH